MKTKLPPPPVPVDLGTQGLPFPREAFIRMAMAPPWNRTRLEAEAAIGEMIERMEGR